MSHYPCTAYCPWNTLANRDMQSCLCYDLSYHREVPNYLNPMRTRPVLLKPPVLPLAVPRLAIKREIRKEDTQRRTDKTFLKFGIDSILNGRTGSSKPSTEQATNYRDTPDDKTSPAEERIPKPGKSVPPKRAVFSDFQRRELEIEFLAHKYISKQERKYLSNRLNLSESQVRIWYQNRRMKWRNRQEREMMRRQRLQLQHHKH